MTDDIRFILESAIRAPSGDNTQTWRFVVRDLVIEVWDCAPHDVEYRLLSNGRAGWVALGAVIENACIAASLRGYLAHVSYAPHPPQERLIATLELTKDASVAPDPLAGAIPDRATNRRPYRRDPLSATERATLLASTGNTEGTSTLHLVEKREDIESLARLVSLHDELIFSNQWLHRLLFSRVTWTRREDKRTRTGLYFPTLETPPFTWAAMQLLRHWWLTKLGSYIGLHKFIALEQRGVYRHASAYGLVLVRGEREQDWLEAGRAVERIWLTATGAGLALQPHTAMIYLPRAIESGLSDAYLNAHERERIIEAYDAIQRIFGVEEGTPAFLFRIGHGRPPSARSSRLLFESVVTVET
ncbi:MAG: hypothetical protein Q7S95_04120 [bacterium]|nr:hypothetical protein [bacterium]